MILSPCRVGAGLGEAKIYHWFWFPENCRASAEHLEKFLDNLRGAKKWTADTFLARGHYYHGDIYFFTDLPWPQGSLSEKPGEISALFKLLALLLHTALPFPTAAACCLANAWKRAIRGTKLWTNGKTMAAEDDQSRKISLKRGLGPAPDNPVCDSGIFCYGKPKIQIKIYLSENVRIFWHILSEN